MFKNLYLFYLFFTCYFFIALTAASKECPPNITVDLRDPIYESGKLSTLKGGVILYPNLRIQAGKLTYRHPTSSHFLHSIEAEENLMVSLGDYLLTGEKFYYDFNEKIGVLENGRLSTFPWFFGGEKIILFPNNNCFISNGYFTTSENQNPDWAIYSSQIKIQDKKFLTAVDIDMRLNRYSLFWVPYFQLNLSTIFESPIRYRFKWGGRQGPRFGLSYQIFSWSNWKTFLRFDYRLTRGPGGGLEFYYTSNDKQTRFQSLNYVAKDSSLIHLHENIRYRFEGTLQTNSNDKKTSLLMTYDKLSDIDMPQSYEDSDFEFETSQRTQLLLRHQEENWISNFYSRLRVNSFQTVKQELPSLHSCYKPYFAEKPKVIIQNEAKVSYLDYKYSDNFIHAEDYASSRFEHRFRMYKPTKFKGLNFVPEIGSVGIFYGASPEGGEKWVALGVAGAELNATFYKYYGPYKHVVEPYLRSRYFSAPTFSPYEHYIFDLNDGWDRLNQLTFGLKTSVHQATSDSASRPFMAHIFTHAFFNYHSSKMNIPKIYADCAFLFNRRMRSTLQTAWDLTHGQIDHFNLLFELTFSQDFAISWEYRHRGSWSWRKVDNENFFLEAFHPNHTLRHSSLSDKRDTLLTHFFYRFRPNWSLEFISRQGWNRKKEPNYLEFEINLFTTIQTAWQLAISYQHQENEDRLVAYVHVGLKRRSGNSLSPLTYLFN